MFGLPAAARKVGNQSMPEKMPFCTVSAGTWPGQRAMHGTRKPPSMIVPLHCANGVCPAIGPGEDLGAVVGREDDDGVVVLAHVLELLHDEADVVIELGHAGFLLPTSRSSSCASSRTSRRDA